MKRIIFFLAGLVLAGCIPSVDIPRATPVDKIAEIQARGTLVIATDPDYTPQSRLIVNSERQADSQCKPTQYAANQFEGFDVDVAKEVARQLGVEACFVTPPWSQLVAGSWGDNWDIHVGSVAITYDRMQNLYFSRPYYATPTVLLVHEENTSYKSPEDLSGKRIGICAGCTFEAYLNGTLEIPGEKIEYRIKNAQATAYASEDPSIQALSLGDGVELDAIMTILPKARAAIQSGAPVKILDGPVLFTYASLTLDRASERDQQRLLTEINRILDDMHATGKLKELSLYYQGVDLTHEAALYDISSLEQFP
ncbi:MAG: transporter substrate-binding domain-containing protein [Chloroflexota bacterium]